MNPEQMKNDELDILLREALQSNSDLKIKTVLAEKTIHRIQKVVFLKQLLMELGIKTGLVLLCLAVFAGVFVFFKGNSLFKELFDVLLNYKQHVILVLLLILVTVIIDQVGLRYFHSTSQKVSATALPQSNMLNQAGL